MPWTEITRPQYRREGLRYAGYIAAAQCALIEPFMPGRRRLGRPRATALRTAVNAIFYIATTGCQWRQLPRELPPHPTVQGHFYQWIRNGRWEIINHALVVASREQATARQARPPA